MKGERNTEMVKIGHKTKGHRKDSLSYIIKYKIY